jgi:hypothetical protein
LQDQGWLPWLMMEDELKIEQKQPGEAWLRLHNFEGARRAAHTWRSAISINEEGTWCA